MNGHGEDNREMLVEHVDEVVGQDHSRSGHRKTDKWGLKCKNTSTSAAVT